MNQPPAELERRLGFHAGRLQQGWMLLRLKQKIDAGEFAFAGDTRFSGGRSAVTLPSGVSLRVSIDDQVRARSTEIDKQLGTGWYMQQKTLADSFVLSGSQRIAKVVPDTPHMAVMPDDEQYPAGSGVPQWVLLQDKAFVVAAVVVRGRTYLGGGAGDSLTERVREFERLSRL